MRVKPYNIDDVAKIVLPLQNRSRNCQNANKTKWNIDGFNLARPIGIGSGPLIGAVILNCKSRPSSIKF